MRVLVEIVHPADVLFFFRPIRMLEARGDNVLIISRDKDVAVDLLKSFGLEHRTVTRAGKGLFGLGMELIRRDFALWRAVRRFRPDVMIGFGGLAVSHVGRLTGVPAISFYDSETATLQIRMTWPFISHLYVPESYQGNVPARRTTRLRGTKDLSFFHPSAFRASYDRARENGLDPERENFFIRVVAWRANHDLGKSGWPQERLSRLVAMLSARGRVHISSELPLPDRYASEVYTGSPRDVHHLMAHCRLYVGESATMACEAITLGVPAIYSGHDFPGYTSMLERAGLLRNEPLGDNDCLLEKVEAELNRPKPDFDTARRNWLADCPDWAEAVVEALDRHALQRST